MKGTSQEGIANEVHEIAEKKLGKEAAKFIKYEVGERKIFPPYMLIGPLGKLVQIILSIFIPSTPIPFIQQTHVYTFRRTFAYISIFRR